MGQNYQALENIIGAHNKVIDATAIVKSGTAYLANILPKEAVQIGHHELPEHVENSENYSTIDTKIYSTALEVMLNHQGQIALENELYSTILINKGEGNYLFALGFEEEGESVVKIGEARFILGDKSIKVNVKPYGQIISHDDMIPKQEHVEMDVLKNDLTRAIHEYLTFLPEYKD